MRIGIYTRKNNEILPSIKWLDDNGFDAFEIYNDDITSKYCLYFSGITVL
jgi:hypothetical protein